MIKIITTAIIMLILAFAMSLAFLSHESKERRDEGIDGVNGINDDNSPTTYTPRDFTGVEIESKYKGSSRTNQSEDSFEFEMLLNERFEELARSYYRTGKVDPDFVEDLRGYFTSLTNLADLHAATLAMPLWLLNTVDDILVDQLSVHLTRESSSASGREWRVYEALQRLRTSPEAARIILDGIIEAETPDFPNDPHQPRDYDAWMSVSRSSVLERLAEALQTHGDRVSIKLLYKEIERSDVIRRNILIRSFKNSSNLDDFLYLKYLYENTDSDSDNYNAIRETMRTIAYNIKRESKDDFSRTIFDYHLHGQNVDVYAAFQKEQSKNAEAANKLLQEMEIPEFDD